MVPPAVIVSGSVPERPGNDARPFAGEAWCATVLPAMPDDPFDPMASFATLLVGEQAELEAELGCPVRWATGADARVAPVRCLIGPAALNPAFADAGLTPSAEPVVTVDRDRRLVAIDGPDVGAVGAAFQLLRSAFRSGANRSTPFVPPSAEGTFDTLAEEALETYPAFALRGLDWDAIVGRHRMDVLATDASLVSMQRWFADLQDAHTWVKDGRINARLPYQAWVEPGRAWLVAVPTWSAAWAAGVRPGDPLLDVDGDAWWSRTAATPRTRPTVTGFRWLAGAVGAERQLRSTSGTGRIIEWTETYQPLPWIEPVSWSVLPSGTAYLRIRGWLHTAAWWERIEAAFRDFAGRARLLVDLRGNVGGSLVAAKRFRDRFLPDETLLGSIQFSIGAGRLSELSPMVGQPPVSGTWNRPVRFLIDRITYSASEDAILGLGGLPHVQIVGEPSGGGSGRPRTIQLRDGLFASISTALTFDRDGRCVEGHGVPVDVALPIEEHLRDPRRLPAAEILAMADRDWPE